MAKVLVVDDERLVRELLRDALARQGHQVVMAESGPAGLDLYIQQRPDVTLLDLNMPRVNGIEVLKKLRAINPTAPVIILTGDERDDLEKLAYKLGVTDFLRKTSSPASILATVTGHAQRPDLARSAPPIPGSGYSLLVVDDEVLLAETMKGCLSKLGYTMRTAHSGSEALMQVQDDAPHMIVLDLYMPGMNGIQLIRELRARGYSGGVIALTASKDEKLLQEALDLGSVDVIGKPVDLDRLALAIEVGLALSASGGTS